MVVVLTVEVELCAFAASTSASLSCMVQRDLGDECSVTNTRRIVASSGVEVASMAGLTRSMPRSSSRRWLVEDGGGIFSSMCTSAC
jgi:hypothetical protein